VSWQLVSFLILAAVLIAGFAWYERSRPPSQVVALVAALAALAIVGRVAFAAFPNVKPTTDIVIFAGYALGGAAGFAVGALAALVSNFWFGQGPWTPWQMAGWGLCGVLGAVFALGVRNAGRYSLAALCGGAALIYGALLNFSLMATYGGDLSWKQFAVLEGRATSFEIAHLVGNIVLALVAGPAMVRMLVRFRERFEWRRRETSEPGAPAPAPPRAALRGGGAAFLLASALALGALAPAPARASDVGRAAQWLVSVQNADGGFGASPGDDSGAEVTCWAMLGLEAVGRNPLDVARKGQTPVDFLRAEVDSQTSPGDLARTILALEGAGVDPRHFGGSNLVVRLLNLRRANGSYLGWPGTTAFAAIALRAAGISGGLMETYAWLRGVQNPDGGWGDTPGSPSTADGTGAVMQALARGSKAVNRGVEYLRKVQRSGGGYSLGGNGIVNSQSTAWAVQGIIAAGGDPANYRRGGATPLGYLAARQRPNGHYRYSRSSDQTPIWVTGEVLAAVAGDAFPIAAPPRAPKASPASEKSSSATGGLSPGTELPGIPAESEGISPGSSATGGGESLPERLAHRGQQVPGAPSGTSPSAGGERGGSFAPAPEASASEGPDSPGSATGTEASSQDSGSGTAGAILLGLLAGCLIFGAAWAARTAWMRWRYGV
jgi:energy-coupling factor transport system substrate-specific component